MKTLMRSVVTGVLLTLFGLTVAAAPVRSAELDGSSVVASEDSHATKYLCQKYHNGYWCTVYVCYCYQDAMDWYNQQPNNARVVAQK